MRQDPDLSRGVCGDRLDLRNLRGNLLALRDCRGDRTSLSRQTLVDVAPEC